MRVHIKSLDGAQAEFDAEPSTTVHVILKHLYEETVLQPSSPSYLHRVPKHLMWRGRDLRDYMGRSLADIEYDEDDKIGIEFVPFDDERELIGGMMIFQNDLRNEIFSLQKQGEAFAQANSNWAVRMEESRLKKFDGEQKGFELFVKALEASPRLPAKVLMKLLMPDGTNGTFNARVSTGEWKDDPWDWKRSDLQDIGSIAFATVIAEPSQKPTAAFPTTNTLFNAAVANSVSNKNAIRRAADDANPTSANVSATAREVEVRAQNSSAYASQAPVSSAFGSVASAKNTATNQCNFCSAYGPSNNSQGAFPGNKTFGMNANTRSAFDVDHPHNRFRSAYDDDHHRNKASGMKAKFGSAFDDDHPHNRFRSAYDDDHHRNETSGIVGRPAPAIAFQSSSTNTNNNVMGSTFHNAIQKRIGHSFPGLNRVTAIVPAIRSGHYGVVAGLIQQGHANKTCDCGGRIPLHYAVKYSTTDMVTLLLAEHGQSQMNCADLDGITPLQLAASLGLTGVVKLMIEALAGGPITVGTNKSTLLHLAAWHGRTETVEYLLQVPQIDSTVVNEEGRTALHLAALTGSKSTVDLLMRLLVDVKVKDKDGRSALHLAAMNGFVEVVSALCFQEWTGIDIFAVDNNMDNAATLAATNGHVDVVKTLHSAMAALRPPKGADTEYEAFMAQTSKSEEFIEILLRSRK